MVSVLSVCEIVAAQVGAGEYNLVIDAVELHVLQSPALVDPFRD